MRTFTKRLDGAPPGFFAVEAAGLEWLAEVDGGVPVARPVRVGEHSIELPFVDTAAPTPAAAQEFGRGLAVTHEAGAGAFGSPPHGWSGDGFIGPLPLPHAPFERWGQFYAALRVGPYARRAFDSGALAPADRDAVDEVCIRLAAGAFDDGSPPARIHGDLWSGNVLWSSSGVVLVDPAAHGGHRLTDLAMLALFGLPHLERVLAGYADAAQLAGGWRDLLALHQLHPLLVHAALFGGSYGARAGDVARRCIAATSP